MHIAKNVHDLGLSTNNLEPMLRFWQQDAGLRFDHVLPVRRGQKQYRHDALGSVIKLNHHIEPLPAAAPSGYRELIIARASVGTPCAMIDPVAIVRVSCRRDMMVSPNSPSDGRPEYQ